MPASPPSWRARADPVLVLAGALVGLSFLLRLPLLRVRGFNPDEFQHLHHAWCVGKGMVPYRDYFDHHTPWLHFVTAPLLSLLDVDTVPADAVAALFMARGLMWVAAGAVLVLTFGLGRDVFGARAGGLATLLLAGSAFFLGKSLEFRPDVPAAALFVGGLWLATRALAAAPAPPRVLPMLALAGAALGSATMFTQKVVFALPGLALAATALIVRHAPAARRDRIRGVGAALLGFAVPVALTTAYFAVRGAAWPFINDNFVLNARWEGPSAGPFVAELVREDAPLTLLGAAGLLSMLVELRRPPLAPGPLVVALTSLSLWLGLLVHPVVTRHYFLLLLPLVAIAAASVLLRLAERLPTRAVVPVLLAAMVGLSVQPLLRLRAAFGRTNDSTLQQIRWVIGNTAPWEPVLDGFTGLGVFRPHLGMHAFQTRDARWIQGPEEERALEEGLRSGRLMPRLVFWNHYLEEGIPPGLAGFLLANYADAGRAPIRVRMFDNGAGWWTDEGPRRLGWPPPGSREPHLYVGRGWRLQPEGSRRRTAGSAAEAWLPVREPGPFHVAVRAWAGPSAPCGLQLKVNDWSSPAACVSAGWHEYGHDAPADAFRRGLNAVRLSYPCPPECRAAPEGRPWLLVETLALRRLP